MFELEDHLDHFLIVDVSQALENTYNRLVVRSEIYPRIQSGTKPGPKSGELFPHVTAAGPCREMEDRSINPLDF
jgi:hypothetical protein